MGQTLIEESEKQMENLLILYYLIAFVVGVFCLGCIFAIHKNNKNEIIKIFLFCYGFFCLFILATIIKSYLDLTMINQSNTLRLVIFALQFFGIFFSLLILTFLLSKIHLVPFTRKANRILLLFTVAIWSFCILREAGLHKLFSLSYLNLIDDELYFVVVIIYNACICYFYRKNIKNLKLYKNLRITFLIFLLNVPGFIMEELLSPKGSRLLFTPFFFILISIFSLYSFFKYHESMQSEKYDITENLRKKIGITEREIDVAKLLLKGYSYQKIADELVISISTVRAHVTSIYKKAGINSRYELYNIIHRIDS